MTFVASAKAADLVRRCKGCSALEQYDDRARRSCQAALEINHRVVGLFSVQAMRCILPQRDKVAQAK